MSIIMPNSGAKSFSEKEEQELLEPGEYEVILESAEPKMYGANMDKPGLLCKFRIRSDVNQPEKNRTILDTAWLDKDVENWEGWYDHKKLHKIILSQPSPRLDFKNCDDCIQYINGLAMKITIDKKFDEYRNKDVNELRYLSYAKSSVGAPASRTAPASGNLDSIVLPDSDLPF